MRQAMRECGYEWEVPGQVSCETVQDCLSDYVSLGVDAQELMPRVRDHLLVCENCARASKTIAAASALRTGVPSTSALETAWCEAETHAGETTRDRAIRVWRLRADLSASADESGRVLAQGLATFFKEQEPIAAAAAEPATSFPTRAMWEIPLINGTLWISAHRMDDGDQWELSLWIADRETEGERSEVRVKIEDDQGEDVRSGSLDQLETRPIMLRPGPYSVRVTIGNNAYVVRLSVGSVSSGGWEGTAGSPGSR